MTEEQKVLLTKPLPTWAVKDHPTKRGMSAIHPMAIIDRLNEVFGVGKWNFKTDYIQCNPWTQKTKNGDRAMYMSAVKGILEVPNLQLHIEQYGGSSNDDMGDALKGGATDALTKCASYLGIGASIYKGQGNVEPPMSAEDAIHKLKVTTTVENLQKVWGTLPVEVKKDESVVKAKDNKKAELTK